LSEWFRDYFDKLFYETYRLLKSEEQNKAEAEFIARALDLPKGSKLLDLGCGYGRHAVYLAKMGFRVTCFDLSDYLLNIARERVNEFGVGNSVEIVKGDMRRLSFHGEFDGVYMFYTTFGYFNDEDNEKVLEGVSRALRCGGKFLLDALNPVLIAFRAYIHGGKFDTWYKVGNYIILESTTYDFNEGYVKSTRKFLAKDTYKLIAIKKSRIRLYMPWELRRLLHNHGLKPVEFLGDYDGSKYSVRSPRIIIIAIKE